MALDLLVAQVHKVTPAHQALLVLRETPATLVSLVLKVKLETLALLVLKVRLVPLDLLDKPAELVLPVTQVPQVQPEALAALDPRVEQALQD